MQQYNIFQAIYMSFYSRQLYRDVAKNWGGKAFLYLLLVVALSWILFTFAIQTALNRGYHEKSDEIVNQIPVLTINEGKISTPENRPYIIEDPKTHERMAVIDTSGKFTSIEQTQTSILVTHDKILSKTSEHEIKTYELPSSLTTTIDARVVNSYIKNFLGYMWIIAYLFFVIVGYIYRLVQAIFYSIIGKMIAGVCKVPLTFGQIMQIAMVAVTPAIVFATIFDFFEVFFLHEWLFYFLLSMFYLFYGIIANKN